MTSENRPSAPGKNLSQQIFDWVNYCDLSQLDAIMLALFVLIAGCGTIGSLYLMGNLQNWMTARRTHQAPAVIAAPAMQYAASGVAAYQVVGRSGRNVGTAYIPHRACTFTGSGSSKIAQTTYPAYYPAPITNNNIAARFGQPRSEGYSNQPAQATASTGFGY